MRPLFLSILLLTCICANAQYSVNGRVLSANDSEPIEMATIQLFKDSNFIQGAQSDMDGYYRLNNVAPGRYVVGISSVGYQEEKQAVVVKDADVTLKTIRIKEQVQALQELQVQAMRQR